MSAQSTLRQLSSSPQAVVDFIIDNNPQGVQSQLDSIGLLPPTETTPTREDLKAAVMALPAIGTQQAMETFQYVLGTEYDSENTNYTGGLLKELEQGLTYTGGGGEAMRQEQPVWVAIVGGLFAVSQSVFGFLAADANADAAESNAEAIQAAGRYDVARNTLFGIPKEIVLAMLAVVGVVAVVAIAKPRRK